jgi:hypothetical protein
MKTQLLIASGILLAAFGNTLLAVPAQAKTEKECAAEWTQLKAHNQTNGQKRKDFIAQCRGTAAAPTTTPAGATKPPAPAPVATGNAVFPSAVSPKYSKESPGRARLHTCRDQYQANKPTNANGGLKWIQKGGGYWSECDKHLKGA